MIRRAEVRTPLTVTATEIRVGDDINIGGQVRRVTTMRRIRNGSQLRLHTGELLSVHAFTPYTVHRTRQVSR